MNFGTPVPLLLGILLILSAVALFFLDKLKPGYERDSDKIYAVLCLLSGIFLLAHLTMELIPSFQQMIMVGMLIALMIQNIRSRSPQNRYAASGAPAEPPLRDDYRPGRPSRPAPYRDDPRANVRAELERDRIPLDEGYGSMRRIPGGRDSRPAPRAGYAQPEAYGDSYGASYPEEARGQGRSERPTYSRSPREDERVRRRRPPLQLRGEMADRANPAMGSGAAGTGGYSAGMGALGSPQWDQGGTAYSSGSANGGSARENYGSTPVSYSSSSSTYSSGSRPATQRPPRSGGPADGDYVDYESL